MIERTEVFRSLVGSHNYNLNTEGSDKDYKVFILPTFDDLYFNRSYSKSIIGVDMDLDIHDLRKATDLWFKANINFLEVLYSSDIELKHSNLSIASHHDMLELISRRDEIARMNLPYLYSACIGMHKQKRHSVLKGTESTQVLIDTYGFNTKQALHSIRVLDFLIRFQDGKFHDFKQAIWYEDQDKDREKLLALRHGQMSLQEYYQLSDQYLQFTELHCQDCYRSHKPDTELYDHLTQIIRQVIKNELR